MTKKTSLYHVVSLVLLIGAPMMANAGMYSISVNYKLSETREFADCFSLEEDIHLRVTAPAMKLAGFDAEPEEHWEQQVAEETRKERASARREEMAEARARQRKQHPRWANRDGNEGWKRKGGPADDTRERFRGLMEKGQDHRRLCGSTCRILCKTTGQKYWCDCCPCCGGGTRRLDDKETATHSEKQTPVDSSSMDVDKRNLRGLQNINSVYRVADDEVGQETVEIQCHVIQMLAVAFGTGCPCLYEPTKEELVEETRVCTEFFEARQRAKDLESAKFGNRKEEAANELQRTIKQAEKSLGEDGRVLVIFGLEGDTPGAAAKGEEDTGPKEQPVA